MSEANEVKEPEWWTAMITQTPEGQCDWMILNDLRSSMRDVDEASRRIEHRRQADSQEIENR